MFGPTLLTLVKYQTDYFYILCLSKGSSDVLWGSGFAKVLAETRATKMACLMQYTAVSADI